MKKRIFAASMASVMALSSVSVVAFADETKADYGEAVTKAELKEILANIEKDVDKGAYDDYGTKFGEIFTKAYEAANLAVEDGDADEIIAAYQVLQSVLAKKEAVTAVELKELVDDLSAKYNRGNIINDELEADYYYDETTWNTFANAYEEAEIACDSDNKTEICDAYFTLEEADNGLKDTNPITKSQLNKAYKAYREVIEQKNKYEAWRRGTATESVNSGSTDAVKPDFKDTLVTYGDLFGIISGDSNATTLGGKAVKGTWIKFSDTNASSLEESIDASFAKFMGLKTATKTANAEIVAAYNACQDAVRVYNGWKVDDVRRGSESSFRALIRSNATTLWTLDLDKDGTADALGTNKAAFFDTAVSNASFTIEGGKIYLNNSDTSDLTVELDTNGKLNYDADGKFVAKGSSSGTTTPKTIVVKTGDKKDVTNYMPEFNLLTANGYLTALDNACKSGDNGVTLTDALQAKANIDGYVKDASGAAKDFSKNFDKTNDTAPADVKLNKEYNDIKNVTAKSNAAAAYSLAYRILEYALDDIIPAPDKSYKKADVKAYVAKANDLLVEAEDSATFANEASALADELAACAEWLAAASKKDYVEYGAVKYTSVKATTDIKSGQNSTQVWTAINVAYVALEAKLAQYPYSYEEIAGTIADVAEGLDEKLYGTSADAIAAAVEKVAYDLVTLKIVDGETNNPYDEDTYEFIKFNRVKGDGSDSEKALVADYEALLKAVKDAVETGDVVLGDVDGDGQPTAKDAKLVLQYAAGQIEFTAAQIKAADFDGDGVPTAKDAKAILMAAAGMTE